ncbi:MAG: ABC transporter permease [Halobacteriota archaeon]
MTVSEFSGTGALIRLILRRDRLLLPIWIALPPLFVILVAAAFVQLYPTAASQQMVATQLANSPGFVALLGPVSDPTIGGLTVWRSGIFAALVVAGGSALTVIRHTRSDEETGRYELLGSGAVGRRAPLAASLVVTLGTDVLIGALVAGGLIAFGLPVTGSVAFGLSLAAIGWMFAALAGFVAQLTESAGVAKAIVAALFVLFYLFRAVGDGNEPSGGSWVSWMSPIGWMHLVKPFANERWGVFVLFLGAVIVLTAMAYALSSRRDVGAGVLRPRLGPATASPRLRSPLALAWRLHRRTLLAWAAMFAVFGVTIGYLAKASVDLLAANAQLAHLYALFGGASAYTDALFTFSLTFAGWIAAAYAVTVTLRLQSEEVEGRVDHVLATPVSRLRWATSDLIIVVIGSVVVLAAFGLSAGLTYGLSSGNVGYELPRMLVATLAYLPAVWVVAGIAMAFYGIIPRFALLSWGVLGAFIGLEIVGETLQMSQSILDLSPFHRVPAVLVSGVSVTPLVSLTLVALVLTIAGLFGFQRRSIG